MIMRSATASMWRSSARRSTARSIRSQRDGARGRIAACGHRPQRHARRLLPRCRRHPSLRAIAARSVRARPDRRHDPHLHRPRDRGSRHHGGDRPQPRLRLQQSPRPRAFPQLLRRGFCAARRDPRPARRRLRRQRRQPASSLAEFLFQWRPGRHRRQRGGCRAGGKETPQRRRHLRVAGRRHLRRRPGLRGPEYLGLVEAADRVSGGTERHRPDDADRIADGRQRGGTLRRLRHPGRRDIGHRSRRNPCHGEPGHRCRPGGRAPALPGVSCDPARPPQQRRRYARPGRAGGRMGEGPGYAVAAEAGHRRDRDRSRGGRPDGRNARGRARRETRAMTRDLTRESTVLASLNAGLRAAMADDERVIVLGEDVLDPYGGAFKVTRGLSSQFPDRVLTTPISEAAIVAVATGLALRGYLPVAEIMFGDFLFLAGDQIVNHAAKYRAMFNDNVRVPLVIRTPMGGRRGYGPTHSQSLEKHFLGIPGLWVVAPNPLVDPGRLLRQAIFEVEDPVLFVENKIGYGDPVLREVPGYDMVRLTDAPSPFPTVWLKPPAPPDGLLLCYGGMTRLALDAAKALREREHLSLGLVVVSQLAPTPAPHLDAVLQETGVAAVVTVEEAPPEGGWGAEMIATIEQIREARRLPAFTYRRVGAKNAAIPSARQLEDGMLPQAGDIVAAVLDCF